MRIKKHDAIWWNLVDGSAWRIAKFARSRAYLHLLQCRMHAMAKSHACCGVVRDCCCDVSALRGAVFEFSAPRCHRQIRPIACTS
jgi:hypothetical protein